MWAAREILNAALGLGYARNPRGWQFRSGLLAEELRECPTCALKTFAAQRAHESRESQGLGRRRRHLAGREKPVEFVLLDRLGEPVQQEARAARERDLAERNAQRELKDAGRRRRGCTLQNKTKKHALDLAAVFGHILRDNEQARMRISGELLFRPDRTGGEFGDGICGLMEFDSRGSWSKRNLRAVAPGSEECLLCGKNAIEAGEQQRRALGGILFQGLNQLERQTRGADEATGAAERIEFRKPLAEGPGVLIPGSPRFSVEQLR